MPVERRMKVGEVVGILRRREPAGGNPFLEEASRHSCSPLLILGNAIADLFFYQLVNFSNRKPRPC